MTTRRELKQGAGFVAARRNDVNRGWVTIYMAEEQGIDVGPGNKYAVVCEEHGTILAHNNLGLARPIMRYPDFCDACMEGEREMHRAAQEALRATAEYQEAAQEDTDPSLAYFATYPVDEAPADLEPRADQEEEDDDPLCVCGTARSEHALCGCPEGFQTPAAWAAEHAIIVSMSDEDYERHYGA